MVCSLPTVCGIGRHEVGDRSGLVHEASCTTVGRFCHWGFNPWRRPQIPGRSGLPAIDRSHFVTSMTGVKLRAGIVAKSQSVSDSGRVPKASCSVHRSNEMMKTRSAISQTMARLSHLFARSPAWRNSEWWSELKL